MPLSHAHKTTEAENSDVPKRQQESSAYDVPPAHEHLPSQPLLRPVCSICGEAPRAYGLLQNCDHSFCESCLRQWRQQGTTNDQDELTSNFKCCPLCRTQSLLCIQSPDFLTGAAKTARIVLVMAPKKDIPCRYFAKSLQSSHGPYCPFGDDCFYQHKLGLGQYLFGAGVIATQRKRAPSRRRSEVVHEAISHTTDDTSDTDSLTSHTSCSVEGSSKPAIRRSGSIGRARTRFGGSGLGVPPMTQTPLTPLTQVQQGCLPPDTISNSSRRRASMGAVAMSATSSGSSLSPVSPAAKALERRGSLAAAAAAARRHRESRASLASPTKIRGALLTNLASLSMCSSSAIDSSSDSSRCPSPAPIPKAP